MPVSKVRLLVLAYFIFAVSLRMIPHATNLSAIGALALFVGCYLSVWQGMLIGLGALALTDVAGQLFEIQGMGLYHRPTMLAVYASFALPSLIGWGMRQMSRDRLPNRSLYWSVPTAAFGSALIFFLVTNFASWLDPEMGYARSLAGLTQCYIAAIPFAKNGFVGAIVFSGLFFGVHAAVYQTFYASHPRRYGTPVNASEVSRDR